MSLVIGIAGGTGSGKSTFTNRIKEDFGDAVEVLYHDNYYKSRRDIPFEERITINYDHPDSLETELLIRHLNELKSGHPINCPIYDFLKHDRTEDTYLITPSPVIIVEGILVFQNEDLRNIFDLKIYVEADADERIMRRAIRDIKERGRDIEGVFSQYVNTVKPMHYQYVEPSKVSADIIINGGMNNMAFDLVITKINKQIEKMESNNDDANEHSDY